MIIVVIMFDIMVVIVVMMLVVVIAVVDDMKPDAVATRARDRHRQAETRDSGARGEA
ncbi:MAG: hypothetical protein ABL967_07215 [Bryobacteraceae bacterium]